MLGFYSALPPADAFPNAKASRTRRSARHPGLAEAYPALAYAAMYYDWDWPERGAGVPPRHRAAPGLLHAHQWYGNFLSVMGGPRSRWRFEYALSLDPLSALRHAALGWGCYFARRYQRGVGGVSARRRAGADQRGGARVDDAEFSFPSAATRMRSPAAEETARLSGYGVSSLGLLGYAYGAAGRSEPIPAIGAGAP